MSCVTVDDSDTKEMNIVVVSPLIIEVLVFDVPVLSINSLDLGLGATDSDNIIDFNIYHLRWSTSKRRYCKSVEAFQIEEWKLCIVLRCTAKWVWTAEVTLSSTREICQLWRTTKFRRCLLRRTVFWQESSVRTPDNRTQWSSNHQRTSKPSSLQNEVKFTSDIVANRWQLYYLSQIIIIIIIIIITSISYAP